MTQLLQMPIHDAILLIILVLPRLSPLHLQRLHPLNPLLIPLTRLPLRPIPKDSHRPLLLPHLTHPLEQILHILIATMAHLETEIDVPDIALLGPCADEALEDGAAPLGVAVGGFEFQCCKLLGQVAVLV